MPQFNDLDQVRAWATLHGVQQLRELITDGQTDSETSGIATAWLAQFDACVDQSAAARANRAVTSRRVIAASW